MSVYADNRYRRLSEHGSERTNRRLSREEEAREDRPLSADNSVRWDMPPPAGGHHYGSTTPPPTMHQMPPAPGMPMNANGVCMNKFATRKSIATGLFNITLFMNNITTLRSLYPGMEHPPHYQVVIQVLLILSLLLQLTSGVMTIMLGKKDLTKITDPAKAKRAEKQNNWISVQTFLITVLNVAVNSLMNTSPEPAKAIPSISTTNNITLP